MKDIKKAFLSLEDARLSKDRKQAIYKRIKKYLYQEELKKMRNIRILIKTASLAGAAAILALGAVFLPGLLKADMNIVTVTQSPQHTNEIVAALTPQPRIVSGVEEESIPLAGPHIIYGQGVTGVESIPPAGTCMISGGVSEAAGDPSNDGAVFYVEIDIYDPELITFYETFTYEGKTVKEWNETPELKEYREGFQAFSNQKYTETDWGAVKASGKGKEEIAQEWEQEWDAIWNETHEINPSAKYHEADQAFLEALKERIKNQLENEVERLISLGLDVKIEETENGYFRMTGLLTSEQIENFPCGDYGYIIRWAGIDDIGLFAASMNDTEKIEIEVIIKGCTRDEMMAAFKAAYPEEYEIWAADTIRDPSTSCPNPKEAQAAYETKVRFCETFYPQKLNAFREKYQISDEDWIMGAYGNEQDAPSCEIWANKAMIQRLLEDGDITKIYILTCAENEFAVELESAIAVY